MPHRADEAKALFLDALDADPGERAALLEMRCGDDAVLRARVEALLAAHDATGDLLDAPPPEFIDRDERTDVRGCADAVTGERIGSYTLLQKLGEGGMGAVWAAEQQMPVRRRVALKLIKPGMDSTQVLRRFEAERQALALMDHTNIAKVFDAGTTREGRPYFAMELVKGVPITKYCDDLNLPLRERLELFVTVCQAIQHAHTKGIIHRDVKPSNVLVCIQDGRPVPKVIDFGVAKALHQRLADRTIYTEIGAMIGTLEYMAPEQAELSALDVDTRADIYALGALLYELLTGTTPLDRKQLASAGLAEMMRIIKEVEPARPSTRLTESKESLAGLAAHRRTEPGRLTKAVRGDLDWIVMRCLEKDRTRRYETANGLARDLQRHLADEPVEARPPGSGYRLRKLVRRNKRPLAAAAIVVVSLVVGTAVAMWQAVRATKAESLAGQRYERERVAREDADAAREDALTEKVAAQAEREKAEAEAKRAASVAEFLQRVLASADPNAANGSDFTVRQLLDEAAVGIEERFGGQPEVEADVRSAVGAAYTNLGLPDQAEPHLARALELQRGFGVDREAYADALVGWGTGLLVLARQRGAEAEAAAREALSIYQTRGSSPEKRLAALRVLQLAGSHSGRNELYAFAAAEAAEVVKELPAGEHAELATILHVYASYRRIQGDLAGAKNLARQAVAMHRRQRPAGHPELGWALLVLAEVLEAEGELADAEKAVQEAVQIFRSRYGTGLGHGAKSLKQLARVLKAESKHAESAAAEAAWDQALRVNIEQAERRPQVLIEQAEAYARSRQPDQAIAAMASLAASASSDPKSSQRVIDAYCRIADILLYEVRDVAGAERLCRAALQASDPIKASILAGIEDPANAGIVRRLADSLTDQGRGREAVPLMERQIAMLGDAGADSTPGWRRITFGRALADSDRPADAAAQFRHALVVFRRPFSSQGIGSAIYFLHSLIRGQHLDDTARRDALAQMTEAASSWVTEVPADAPAHAWYVEVLAEQERWDEALAAVEQASQAGAVDAEHWGSISWHLAWRGPITVATARLAVALAEAAATAAPLDRRKIGALGTARYRAGDWTGTVAAMNAATEMDGGNAFDWYVLAMAHRRLGDDNEARRWYDRAVEWHETHMKDDDQLRRFRDEAEAVLAIKIHMPVEAPRPKTNAT